MTEAPPTHLLLLGLRASGKSTLARLVADRANIPAVDLDDVVLHDMQANTIDEIWRTQGEPAFRQAETTALARHLDSTTPSVIALGGGTPTAPGAADLLRDARAQRRIFLVYLRIPPNILRARLESRASDPNRPTLTGAGTTNEIDAIFDQRDALYRDLADLVIERAHSPGQDAEDILQAWRAHTS